MKDEREIIKELKKIAEQQKEIAKIQREILKELRRPHLAVKIFLIDYKNQTPMSDLTLTLTVGGSSAGVAATGVDANGNTGATIQNPEWIADDSGNIVSVVPSPDGLSAEIRPIHPGVSHITVNGLDANGNQIAQPGTATVTVVSGPAGLAVSIQLTQTS